MTRDQMLARLALRTLDYVGRGHIPKIMDADLDMQRLAFLAEKALGGRVKCREIAEAADPDNQDGRSRKKCA